MTERLRITEREFQRTVIELARACGWTVAHFRAAQTARGWRTPVEADGAGFPDLVLVRERVIFAELKRDGAKTTKDQDRWLAALSAAGAQTAVWRPGDWPMIEKVLTTRRQATA